MDEMKEMILAYVRMLKELEPSPEQVHLLHEMIEIYKTFLTEHITSQPG